MAEQNNPSGKPSKGRMRWIWYRILLALIPACIPFAYFYLTGKEAWSLSDFAAVFGLFVAYWLIVMLVVGRSLRGRIQRLPASQRASDDQHHYQPVCDEQAEERIRARRDNEHLRQQAG